MDQIEFYRQDALAQESYKEVFKQIMIEKKINTLNHFLAREINYNETNGDKNDDITGLINQSIQDMLQCIEEINAENSEFDKFTYLTYVVQNLGFVGTKTHELIIRLHMIKHITPGTLNLLKQIEALAFFQAGIYSTLKNSEMAAIYFFEQAWEPMFEVFTRTRTLLHYLVMYARVIATVPLYSMTASRLISLIHLQFREIYRRELLPRALYEDEFQTFVQKCIFKIMTITKNNSGNTTPKNKKRAFADSQIVLPEKEKYVPFKHSSAAVKNPSLFFE